MRRISPIVCMALLSCSMLLAEGTREMAPNGDITIGGNSTTDVAALHINNPNYNSFAAYDNGDPQSRLYIHLLDPTKECLFVGFSYAHANSNVPNPPRESFEFRIKDPEGNIVFGPRTVDPVDVNINSWSEGYNGPAQLVGVNGYDAIEITSAMLTSMGNTAAGDYYIEFRNEEGDDLLIDFWDITVVDCSTANVVEKKGRVWSYNWSIFAINDYGFPNRPFNGAFYVCAPDPDNEHASFITKIDFNGSGFRPAAFNIAINSFGAMNTGNLEEDRKSKPNINSTQAEYAIFLNDPVEICETAEIGTISLEGVSTCDSEGFCIKFISSKAGQIDLLLDFDGPDNVYTPGTADVLLTQTITSDQVNIPVCIEWNGRDGLNFPHVGGESVPVVIAYAQGIYHFPIYDAELMTNGVIVYAVRPAAPNPLLYYDDSNIGVPSGSGEPVMQLSGCATPCHAWTNYTQPNTVGFGNLSTINTWWFSQLVVTEDFVVLPGYFTCEAEGPERFCHGSVATISGAGQYQPATQTPPDIYYEWTGPGIVSDPTLPGIEVDQSGEYIVNFYWVSASGDTCRLSCSHTIAEDPPLTASIDTLILVGETVTINNETYSEGGVYTQLLTTGAGCDSILTITVKVINSVVHYDLNACEAFMSNNTHMDYSEFVPAFPQPLSCADITGGTLHRTPPDPYKHSCTPGAVNSVAMCVSSLEGCSYVAGHDASIVFVMNVNPDPDTAVQVTGISFYEQAPADYNWISGSAGPNNWPTLYGIRVLKNGVEIYRQENIATASAWHPVEIDFLLDDDFIVEDAAEFRFELLPYCPVGNGATVSAWDIDEVNIQASCVSPSELNPLISGVVKTPGGIPVHDVNVSLSEQPDFLIAKQDLSDDNGRYGFEKVERQKSYYLKAGKNGDYLNGVSTLDLIQVQKHLLGISTFHSPYQFLAADANKSHSITIMDIVELRKLLLGIYAELPRNTSWRFGDAKQIFLPGGQFELDEVLSIETATTDVLDLDFTAIKIGDLNGDVTGFANQSVTSRTSKELSLTFTNQYVGKGKTCRVDLVVNETIDFMGMQFSLLTQGLEIVDIISAVPDFDDSNYRVIPNDEIRFTVSRGEPVRLNPNDVVLSLVVRSHSAGWLSDLIVKKEFGLASEIYVGEEPEVRALNFKPIDLGNENELQVFEIHPNPVTDEARIDFTLATPANVSLQFFNSEGMLVKRVKVDGIAGINRVSVSKQELPFSNGLIICHLQTDQEIRVQKFILMNE